MIVRSPKYINPYKLFVGSFVPNWLMERPELSPGAKLTYARLAQYAGRKGEAWPAVETLAVELAVTRSQTHRYLAELTEAKLIERERRGLNQTNKYLFLLHDWMDFWNPDVADTRHQEVANMPHQDVADPLHIRESSEENQLKDPPLSPNGGKRAQKSPTPWPSDLKLNLGDVEFAFQRGINAKAEFDAWHDDCAAHDRRYIDWKAAWRTRCRNAVRFGTANGQPAPAPIRAGLTGTPKFNEPPPTAEQRAAARRQISELVEMVSGKIGRGAGRD